MPGPSGSAAVAARDRGAHATAPYRRDRAHDRGRGHAGAGLHCRAVPCPDGDVFSSRSPATATRPRRRGTARPRSRSTRRSPSRKRSGAAGRSGGRRGTRSRPRPFPSARPHYTGTWRASARTASDLDGPAVRRGARCRPPGGRDASTRKPSASSATDPIAVEEGPPAIERALLFESERDLADRRHRGLREVAAGLAAAVAAGDVADVLVGAAAQAVGAQAAAVGLVDLDTETVRLARTVGADPIDIEQCVRSGIPWPGSVAMAGRGPVWIRDVQQLRSEFPDLPVTTAVADEVSSMSWASVPLVSTSGVLGFYHACLAGPRRDGDATMTELRTIAAQASQALDPRPAVRAAAGGRRDAAAEPVAARATVDRRPLDRDEVPGGRRAPGRRRRLVRGGCRLPPRRRPRDRRRRRARRRGGQHHGAAPKRPAGPRDAGDRTARGVGRARGLRAAHTGRGVGDRDLWRVGHPDRRYSAFLLRWASAAAAGDGRRGRGVAGRAVPVARCRARGTPSRGDGPSRGGRHAPAVHRRSGGASRGALRPRYPTPGSCPRRHGDARVSSWRADAVLLRMLYDTAQRDDVAVLCVCRAPATDRRFSEKLHPHAAELSSLRMRLGAWLTREGVDAASVDTVVLAANEALANARSSTAATGNTRIPVTAWTSTSSRRWLSP